MIILDKSESYPNGYITKGPQESEGIKTFAVWFQAVDGLCTTLLEAQLNCEKHGIDPSMLRPVPVAIGVHGHYEIFMR